MFTGEILTLGCPLLSDKEENQELPWGGTQRKGHQVRAWTSEQASLHWFHLGFFSPPLLTQRSGVSSPAPAQIDTSECPCQLQGAICKDDVQMICRDVLGGYMAPVMLLPQKTPHPSPVSHKTPGITQHILL